jgi:putative transcriptional regulator
MTNNAHPSALEAAHEIAQGFHRAGLIDNTTMRDFDAQCLPDVQSFSAKAIKALRLHEKVSQAVFAKLLNTSTSTVRQWEQDAKHPRGTSLKLLDLVSRKGLGVLC